MTLGTYRCLLQLRLWLCEPIVVAVIKNEQSIYIKKEIIGGLLFIVAILIVVVVMVLLRLWSTCCVVVAVVTLLLWFKWQWILSEKNFATIIM